MISPAPGRRPVALRVSVGTNKSGSTRPSSWGQRVPALEAPGADTYLPVLPLGVIEGEALRMLKGDPGGSDPHAGRTRAPRVGAAGLRSTPEAAATALNVEARPTLASHTPAPPHATTEPPEGPAHHPPPCSLPPLARTPLLPLFLKFPRQLDASHLPVERPQSFCHRIFLSRFQGIRNCPGLHGPWHRVLEGLGWEDAIGQTRGLRPGPEAQRPRVRDAGRAAEPKGVYRRGAGLRLKVEQPRCGR